MKNLYRICVLFLCVLTLFGLTAPAASAANKSPDATPELLIETVAQHLGVPASGDALVELGIITKPERRFFSSHHCITAAVAWRILLPVYGVFPYPVEFYPEVPLFNDCANIYGEARVAAIITGLGSADRHPNIRLSEEEFYTLVDKLENGNYTPIEPPTALPSDLAATTWTHENYRYRNAALLAAKHLPNSWIKDFHANDWRIKCKWQLTDNGTSTDAEKYQSAGLTHYGDRTIYLSSYSLVVIAHEFTHYTANRLGWKHDFLLPYYQSEAANVADILPAYAQTKPAEYFAEFVAHWIVYPNDQAALTEKAPNTTALTQLLINEYSDILPPSPS